MQRTTAKDIRYKACWLLHPTRAEAPLIGSAFMRVDAMLRCLLQLD